MFRLLNPYKAGLSEGSFFLGGGRQFENLTHPSHFKKSLSKINVALCNCYVESEKMLTSSLIS